VSPHAFYVAGAVAAFAAARIKPTRAHVRDEARIAQVLDNVRREADREGLSLAIAEPVWRTLIERCIAHEFEVYDLLKPQGALSGENG
jgi:isochorismate pyruvate lyase